MSMFSSLASNSAGRIRVILCEPDSEIRSQLRSVIDTDPLLILAAELRNWTECEEGLDEIVPELLIVRSDLIPEGWGAEAMQDCLLPVIITLRRPQRSVTGGRQSNFLAIPVEPGAVRTFLNNAIRHIYARKAKQLLYLVERYAAGSNAHSGYKSVIRVERDRQPIDLRTEKIGSLIAARKCTRIHSTDGDFLLREPIHLLAAKLDPYIFVRIHRSVIINRSYLARTLAVTAKSFFVVLLDGSKYPVGARYRSALDDAVKLSAA